MSHTSLTPAKYAQQIKTTPERLDAIPVADSPEDVMECEALHRVETLTVDLDGGAAIVEHLDDRVEVTVRIGDRLTAALILSPAEAEALGMAIARPGGPTTGDLFALADAMHADAADLAKLWDTAPAEDARTDSLAMEGQR